MNRCHLWPPSCKGGPGHDPELSPRRNAPLAAVASRRSRMRKQNVFDRKLRIGNYATMATASSGPSASAIFAKHLALLQRSVTWLKPKAITPISASAGATRPSRCEPRKSRDCTRTILSWQARSIGYSLAQMTLPIVSEMGTPAPWQPRAIVLSRFSAGSFPESRRVVRHLRLHGFCVRVASRHPDRGRALLGVNDSYLRSIKVDVR